MTSNPRRSADRVELGQIVRLARQARGLTLAEFGHRVGYSPSQISRLERGRASLTDIRLLRKFAAALAVPPQVFGLLPEAGQPDAPTGRAVGLSCTSGLSG